MNIRYMLLSITLALTLNNNPLNYEMYSITIITTTINSNTEIKTKTLGLSH